MTDSGERVPLLDARDARAGAKTSTWRNVAIAGALATAAVVALSGKSVLAPPRSSAASLGAEDPSAVGKFLLPECASQTWKNDDEKVECEKARDFLMSATPCENWPG